MRNSLMARALIMGPKEMSDIRAAYERASARPIPWEVLQLQYSTKPQKPSDGMLTITIDDRKSGIERAPSEQVLIPMGYRMAISLEQQPAGLLAHFSFSVEGGKPGALPTPISVKMILDVLGFDFEKACGLWQEEFLIDGEPGGLAINVLFMVDASAAVPVAGHA